MSLRDTPAIIDMLRKNNKGSFETNAKSISYKTGFATLDYYVGYKRCVFDKDGNLLESSPCVGIPGGCFATFVGKPGTGKSTIATQVAANIVRNYPNGFVMHYDLEQAATISRIQSITKYPIEAFENGKYILKQDRVTIDDIYEEIVQIWKMKMDNADQFSSNTGVKDEFDNEIIQLDPTVLVVDSIANLVARVNTNVSSEMKKLESLEGQTYAQRIAGEISQFFKKTAGMIHEANIIVILINQVKDRPNQGTTPQSSNLMYMKNDTTLPGGWAPMFMSHILLNFVAASGEKFEVDKDGFDGFGINAQIVKCRTNQAGQSIHLIYDKVRGADPIRSCIQYAKDKDLLVGRMRNSMAFASNPDMKFNMLKANDSFAQNPELFKEMYKTIVPHLEERLPELLPTNETEIYQLMDY